ncbi:MAG: addiction module toxin, HicA family [Flavobacteriales bacterium]|nr:MAG: addiction module toxin, HicA family [Flavobacteriales bacterium]
MSSKDIIKLLKKNGFKLDRIKGSHHIFIHPQSRNRAVVPHPKKDLPIGTARSILRQAGIN